MDALKAIFTRRSIRKYTDEPVSREDVDTLLRAAMIAPSTINNRDWAFVVVDDREKLCRLADALGHDGEMLRSAPVAIAVCGDWELACRYLKGYWVMDVCAATENILIAANAMGLGAVWLGVYPQSDKMIGLWKTLNLPQRFIPGTLICLGHPAEEKEAKDAERFETEKVFYNEYGAMWR